jgi:hypothetical protein
MKKPEGNFNKKAVPEIDPRPNPQSLTVFWKVVAWP